LEKIRGIRDNNIIGNVDRREGLEKDKREVSKRI